ncbi:mucin-13 [Tupaia chinensis]|uniref:mucin-13 n=1 Tax=Tupaia chinensis TaxID=246437 RepID=UPI000FFB6DD1|nr:mucin-13 [Tupaia chinensis]
MAKFLCLSPEIVYANISMICPINPCENNTCEDGSSCVALNSTSFCLCSEGYYYKQSTCLKGKVFPGYVVLQLNKTTDLESKTSQAYEDLHEIITKFFGDVFNQSDFGQTVILKVSVFPSRLGRSDIRADLQGNVSVVNIFAQNTSKTEESVKKTITDAIDKGGATIKGFTSQNRCDYYGCNRTGGECADGLLCDCKIGLERPNPQVSFCLPVSQKCPENCNAKNNMQCLMDKDGQALDCVCLSGFRKNNETCEKCPFGYSGVDCKDSFELILTIVGTITGIIIISLLIALIFSARSKNKKKNIEEQNLIENDFQDIRLEQTGFSNLGTGTIFPKIRIAASKDSEPQNPYTKNPYASQSHMPRPDY